MQTISFTSSFRKAPRRFGYAGKSAFTLVELLVVIAIMAVLSSMIVFSFNGILGGSFQQSVSDFSSAMEQARSYAMANNTYVYVGVDEVNANDTSATPATGNGVVVVAVAASRDGTDGFNGGTTWSASSNGVFNLVPISKLKKFSSLHLAQLSNVTGNMSRPTPGSPSFYVGTPVGTASFGFGWPLAAATPNYNFSTLIRFSPQGGATILTSTTGLGANTGPPPVVDYLEVGMQPIHGNAIGSVSANNISAIQIDGMTGTVRAYRP